MLGAAQASQYAGWWSDRPPSVVMSATGALGYEVYQTPSFSWENNTGDGTYPTNTYITTLALGNVNVSSYSSLSGFNNNKWTMVMTFKLHMATGLTTNQGIKMDNKFQGASGDFTTNMAWVAGYNSPVKLQINWPGDGAIELPATGYDAYNDQWLTLVATCSNSSSDYLQWSGTGTGSYYHRTCVYYTDTAELIKQYDTVSSTRPLGFPTAFDTWFTSAGGNISTNRSDSYSYSLGGTLPDTQSGCTIKIANYWFAFGTMFDPIMQKAAGDSSWLTTRPSKTIGTAEAWFNGQMATVGNTASYANVWSTTNSMDNFTPTESGHQVGLIINGTGNSTVFNARYSTTDIPKSSG